jgi:hypothetical protein
MQTSFEVPVCTAQGFTYIAMTGGLPVSGEPPCLSELILLSSDHTTMRRDSDECPVCSNVSQERDWNFVRQSIVAEDLESILKLSSKSGRQISLSQAPFLGPTARPESNIYSFGDGSVHDYFSDLFIQGSAEHVATVCGPTGLLQAQWNHGDSRQYQPVSPTDK